MPDLEKAIRILEGNYKNFVLRDRNNREVITVTDIIALLKAQGPVDVIPVITKDGKMLMAGNCPECGMRLDHFFNGNYCGCCGRRVKWE